MACESCYILWSTTEFDDPLVATFAFCIHKHWGCGVFAHFCSCGFAGSFEALFGIVHHEFFTKGVDETLGTTRDDELPRAHLGEAHSVADLVTPKTTRGGDDEGIVATCLHFPDGENGGIVAANFFERDKFIEDVVVEHEFHGLIGRIGLESEESFRSIVGFHVVHLVGRDEAQVLFAVGGESHSTVEEYF